MSAFSSSRRLLLSVSLLLLLPSVSCDVYMHMPRGSNNRLNEPTATRANNNRAFNSQNNARGGHNVGDRIASAFSSTQPTLYSGTATTLQDIQDMYDPTLTATAAQYSLLYMEGSVLQVEWTNQHGCGGNEADDSQKQNCDIILQYMCETGGDDSDLSIIRGAEVLRDGGTTSTPAIPTTIVSPTAEVASPSDGLVRHESANYYYECLHRSRNTGLFTADQQLPQGSSAAYTRQSPQFAQYGLECPEERDYYPYWSPSPWKDIAVLTDHPQDKCDANNKFTGASQNNHIVYRCIPQTADQTSTSYTAAWAAITEQACSASQGLWANYSHGLPAPDCLQANWSRVNHLGNGRDGQTLAYNWTLPLISDLISQGVNLVGGLDTFAKCVLRIRYNISTDDFSPYTTDFSFNGALSPVLTNQQFDIGAPLGIPLQLLLNTAQTARTFQDRSHIFFIAPRPAQWANRTIRNLSVRGRRCNIVQCFPAVEFDFTPANIVLNATAGDLLHVQWTGSNTDNNNGNGGDGQTGDAGQGNDGTDRNNLIQLQQYGGNYPIAYDLQQDNMISRSNCFTYQATIYGNSAAEPEPFTGSMTTADVDCALFLWSSGYWLTQSQVLGQIGTPLTTNTQNDLANMNNAPPSLIGGVILDYSDSLLTNATTYPYFCSRNNAFSNRAQKGVITVVQ